jgi:hypothetical protein
MLFYKSPFELKEDLVYPELNHYLAWSALGPLFNKVKFCMQHAKKNKELGKEANLFGLICGL